MTPLNPQAPRSGPLTGLVAGALVAAVLLCLGTTASFFWVRKKAADARKGWNLVPVVVAAVDIPEDSVVTMEVISQRSIPEQFVTSSVVKPDSASYVVNQKTHVALQAGDPLRWSDFGSQKSAKVLFVTHDVALGAELGDADVEEREVPQALVTGSWVTSADRPQLAGRRAIAPFRKGDPLLWTHLPPAGAK